GVGLWWTAPGRSPAPAATGVAEGQATSSVGDTAARSRTDPGPEPGLDAGGSGTTARRGAGGGSTSVPSVVHVHAAGAVVAPGLYRLASGARVADLVAAAGGLTVDADADRVNLAAPVVDG